MDSELERQLTEVFGGGMNVAPGGTGAVLTRPSKLSMGVAEQAVRGMPLDGVYRDLGAVAARVLADELEARSLRAADYANLPDLPKVVAKRLVGYLLRSEEFARSFSEHLSARG
jgi:hypothetical protein